MNWGILSTGVIAKNFAETARMMDDVHIHAVASRSLESANAFADQYGIPVRHGSALALAQDPDVDIVYIATPHNAHYEGMKLMIWKFGEWKTPKAKVTKGKYFVEYDYGKVWSTVKVRMEFPMRSYSNNYKNRLELYEFEMLK